MRFKIGVDIGKYLFIENPMFIKFILGCIFSLGLMGCHSLNAKSQATGETQECLAYRAMMTAPMDPLAMQQLKTKCLESRK